MRKPVALFSIAASLALLASACGHSGDTSTRAPARSTKHSSATTVDDRFPPSPNYVFDKQWKFSATTTDGWDYNGRLVAKVTRIAARKDIKTSPAGKAKMRLEFSGNVFLEAESAVPGRTAPPLDALNSERWKSSQVDVLIGSPPAGFNDALATSIYGTLPESCDATAASRDDDAIPSLSVISCESSYGPLAPRGELRGAQVPGGGDPSEADVDRAVALLDGAKVVAIEFMFSGDCHYYAFPDGRILPDNYARPAPTPDPCQLKLR
ncbi:MAG TPA: hypothetical protein VHD87_15605 [Acidimicrobiales bacterium]|nr:hypothetical protein [Acidimicrobiales bacterium]